MKTIKDLYNYLDAKIPRSLSCEWDNDGLMVSGDISVSYNKILLSLDVTYEVVEYAIDNGYDVIISHHPLIFKGLKSVNDENFVADKVIKLIKNGVSAFSFHTRLDACDSGVNDALANVLGIVGVTPFGNDGEMIGRVGELEAPISVEELAKKVKDVLNCDRVTFVCGEKIAKRVCVLGGDGKDFLGAAASAGADVYVTGNMSYNTMLDAADMGMAVIEAGHFESENPVLSKLEEMIREFDADVKIGRYKSNPVKTV